VRCMGGTDKRERSEEMEDQLDQLGVFRTESVDFAEAKTLI
jgi:hypothetical protein